MWVVSLSGTRPNDSANHRAASATLRKWLSFLLLCSSDNSSTVFPWFTIAALSNAIFSITCLKVLISSCLSAISTSVSASSARRSSTSSNKGCGATVLPRYTGMCAHFPNSTSFLRWQWQPGFSVSQHGRLDCQLPGNNLVELLQPCRLFWH